MKDVISWAVALVIVAGSVAIICLLAVAVFALVTAFPHIALAAMVLVGAASVATLLWVVVAGVRDWVSERL